MPEKEFKGEMLAYTENLTLLVYEEINGHFWENCIIFFKLCVL